MGRVDIEFTKLGGASVLDAPRGPRRDMLHIKNTLEYLQQESDEKGGC